MAETSNSIQELTPRRMLFALQRILTEKNQELEGEFAEPFPVEFSDLFLYSPDGESVLLVFPFLGQSFVLSEEEIATEIDGQIFIIQSDLEQKVLEYLVLRLRILKTLNL